MTLPSERRGRPRRADDRAVDNLQKTFRSCLDRMADGVLLLDNELRVIYATPQTDQILSGAEIPLALTPKFTLTLSHKASRFAAFANGKNSEAGPLSLLLEAGQDNRMLLLTCFRLPDSATSDLYAARYMVTLRDPSHYPVRLWQFFIERFNLTPAEARLCRNLVDGLTLNDYSAKWHITISTARSQLSSVLAKTSTRRQSDLLRLIFLFTRT